MQNQNHLDLVKLPALMEHTSGNSAVVIGLIDGPVALNHPDLASENIREIPGRLRGTCAKANSAACMHGTFVASILLAKRNSAAPAICPGCTLLVRPIFAETASDIGKIPIATPGELATAIIECIDAGAQVINMSIALAQPSSKSEHGLEEVLDNAASRGVIIVAAAGNQGTVGSSAITRHPWVIPVVACNLQGRPTSQSNLSGSIGIRGLMAPGEDIIGLNSNGALVTFGGTSAATPFVTGTIALLRSQFTTATATQVKLAVKQVHVPQRATVVPSLLDAMAAYKFLLKSKS